MKHFTTFSLGLLLAAGPLLGEESLSPAKTRSADGLKKADQALKVVPPSVTHKTIVAPSGSRNDYASTAPYFWPDPSKPDGKPYIRHDGKINPESRTAASDIQRSTMMSETAGVLATAYTATRDEKYAAHAARVLRTWFLDPSTRMNPHLQYAQGVPGVSTGRQIGIIEGGTFVEALAHGSRLAGSAAWSAADQAALMTWATEFLDWYLTSDFGIKEGNAGNNHGTHYDTQVMRLALMLDRRDLARQVAESAKQKRIAAQIEPDGKQPRELARATSLSYSTMNLRGLTSLANLAERVGVDLWHFETQDGRSIRKAIDFLAPYAQDPEKKWPYEQIKDYNRRELAPLFRQAAKIYRDPKYEQIAEQLSKPASDRARP